MFKCDLVQLASYMLGMLLLILWVVKLDEYELREVVVEIEFQGKFRWVC